MIESYSKLREGIKRVVGTLDEWNNNLNHQFDYIPPNDLDKCSFRLGGDKILVEYFLGNIDGLDKTNVLEIKIRWLELRKEELIKEFTKIAEVKAEEEANKLAEEKEREYKRAKRIILEHEREPKVREKVRWLREIDPNYTTYDDAVIQHGDDIVYLFTFGLDYCISLPVACLDLDKKAFVSYVDSVGNLY